MATIRGPITMDPRVQAVADEIEAKFGVTSFGSYQGHGSATPRRPDLALDIFVTKQQGDQLAKWLVENHARLGVWFIAWWQRKWNGRTRPQWVEMEDRGSDTANHKDHIHLDFDEYAQPVPIQENDEMLIIFNKKNQGFLLAGGKLRLLTGQQAAALQKAGVPRKDLSNDDVDALYTLNA